MLLYQKKEICPNMIPISQKVKYSSGNNKRNYFQPTSFNYLFSDGQNGTATILFVIEIDNGSRPVEEFTAKIINMKNSNLSYEVK